MKVLTFFNEKGGTGKTTLTALCANYFAYKLRQPVVCVDYDAPSYQLFNIRQNDNKLLKANKLSAFAKECALSPEAYRIYTQTLPATVTPAYLAELAKSMMKMVSGLDGYLFLDFPGSLRPLDPAFYFITRGLIDLTIMPVDSDRQSEKAALSTFDILRDKYIGPGTLEDRTLVLWNREATKERQGKRDWYAQGNTSFGMLGIPVAERKVRDILIARRDADTFGFIRNTLCWPENNIRKACGYLPSIFDEIKARVDGEWTEQKKLEIYGEKEI